MKQDSITVPTRQNPIREELGLSDTQFGILGGFAFLWAAVHYLIAARTLRADLQPDEAAA